MAAASSADVKIEMNNFKDDQKRFAQIFVGTNKGSDDGVGTEAQLEHPFRLFPWRFNHETKSEELIFLDRSEKFRTVNLKTKAVKTLCGYKPAIVATGRPENEVHTITTFCTDPNADGKYLYMANSNQIWKLTFATTTGCCGLSETTAAVAELIAGSDAEWGGHVDGVGGAAKFKTIWDMICTKDGKVLIVNDQLNNKLRHVDIASKTVTTLKGTGDHVGSADQDEAWSFQRPDSIALDATETQLYVLTDQHQIFCCDLKTKIATTVIHKSEMCDRAITLAPSGMLILASQRSIAAALNATMDQSKTQAEERAEKLIPLAGNPDREGRMEGDALSGARFDGISSMVFIASEKALYATDSDNHCIRRINMPDWIFKA